MAWFPIDKATMISASEKRRIALVQQHLKPSINGSTSKGIAIAPCAASGAENVTVPQSGRSSLAEERAQATFSPRDMTYFLDGGSEATQIREKIMLELERDPSFRMDDWHDLTRPELRARYMTRVTMHR